MGVAAGSQVSVVQPGAQVRGIPDSFRVTCACGVVLPCLIVALRRWRLFLFWLARHELSPDGWRPGILRRAGFDVSRTAVIFSGIRISGDGLLCVGERAFISHDCFVDCSGTVTIGSDVALAAGVRLVSSGHDHSDPTRRAGARHWAPITVRDGSWLGAGCTVLGGVTVGPGVVVAAGAVVTRDCAANGLYAGVPARRVKDLQPA